MNRTKKPEPLKTKCFRCKQNFLIKFVNSTWNYSRKNSWNYWTENKEDKDKKICDPCLLDTYYNDKEEYLSNVVNRSKRNLFRNYVSNKIIKAEENN